MGSGGWNEFQSGVDKIPVVLIAAAGFKLPGPANRGVAQRRAGGRAERAGQNIGDRYFRTGAATFDDTHSIVSDQVGLKWDTALTWDPQVLDVVHQSIQEAPKALDGANREAARRPRSERRPASAPGPPPRPPHRGRRPGFRTATAGLALTSFRRTSRRRRGPWCGSRPGAAPSCRETDLAQQFCGGRATFQ